MILKNNLATTPVKNDSLYFIGCMILALGTLVFTVLNVRSMLSWQEESGRLQQNIVEQQKKSAASQNKASQLRTRIKNIKTPEFVNETEFMNNAIERRTFSWTTLFDEFERIFPDNVRMVSVIPQITGKNINVNMEVSGKGLNDIIDLITILQNASAFSNVVFRSERQDADGMMHATITLKYTPEKVVEGSSGEQTKPGGPPPQEEPAAAEEES